MSLPKNIPEKKILYQQNGFSLTEVLIVITIFVIVAATAAPNVTKSVAKQKRKVEKNNVSSLLQRARTESLVRRRKVVMEMHEATADSPAKITLTPKNGKIIVTHELDEKVILTLNPINTKKIEFSSEGNINISGGDVTGAQDVLFTLCHKSLPGGNPESVKVSANTRISNSKEGSCE